MVAESTACITKIAIASIAMIAISIVATDCKCWDVMLRVPLKLHHGKNPQKNKS